MSELAVRASSWGEIFDCGYRWEGKNLLGMRLPAGLRTVLGSAIHAATHRGTSSKTPERGNQPRKAASADA